MASTTSNPLVKAVKDSFVRTTNSIIAYSKTFTNSSVEVPTVLEGPGINDIPPELLFIIFNFLPGKSIFIVQQACKSWNSLINQSSSNFWKSLYYSHLGQPSTYAKQIEKKKRKGSAKREWKQKYLRVLQQQHSCFKGKKSIKTKVNYKEEVYNYAKLLWAVKCGHSNLVEKYIDKHGKDLVNYKWDYPSSVTLTKKYPWFDAALQDSLIKYKDSLLHVASANGHTKVVQILIPFVNNIDHLPIDNETALYWAARYGFVDIITLLHAAGASLEAPNNGLGTPLERAFREGRTETIFWLLEHGASYGRARDTSSSLFISYLTALAKFDDVDDLDGCAAKFFDKLCTNYSEALNDINVPRYDYMSQTNSSVLDFCIDFNWMKTKEVLLKHGAKSLKTIVDPKAVTLQETG